MVPMTPELDEALREWVWIHEQAHQKPREDRDLYAAYRAAQRAEPEPQLGVGQRVRSKSTSRTGVIAPQPKDRTWILYDDDSDYVASDWVWDFEPIPDLPPDHIDRFWRVGAWLTNGSVDYHIVVMSANVFARLWSDGSITSGKQSELDRDGWSFHSDSPIKEEVEL